MRLHWPRELRPAFDALFDIDEAMGMVVERATEPAIGAIKLAWWREQLQRLDADAPPAEPRLQAATEELLPRGIAGHELARLEAGWATLLDECPQVPLVEARGETLFELAARLLEANDSRLGEAGRLYALMDVTRRGLRDLKGAASAPPRHRFAPTLRPLTGLVSLARRDWERGSDEAEATPGRSWTLIRHRITGRI